VTQNVQLTDVFPTLCQLAGRAFPEYPLDGTSLLDQMKAPDAAPDWAFSEFYDWNAYRPMFMLKRGPWKFCHYPGEQDFLYQVEEDPGETINRATDPACQETLAALRTEMQTRFRPVEREQRACEKQAMRREIHAATTHSIETKARLKAHIKAFRDAWNEPYWDDNRRQGAHEPFLD
jgi:choline-sulfatase